jgi:D-alanyl-D-alanine carboxypeptidase
LTKTRTSSRFLPIRRLVLAATIGWLGGCSAPAAAADCATGPKAAASANQAGLETLAWSPSSRAEAGWETYAPLAAHEIGSACPAASPGFAAALARWQAAHEVGAGGVMDGPTLQALNQVWIARRPFVKISGKACPDPPPEASLARAAPAESYGGKTIELRPGAVAAYRAMVAAARRDLPQLAADKRLMTLFSGYRSPDADAARCAAEGNCHGVVRASCSAHRTGLAFDIDLGAAPGDRIDSADDANRLFITRGAPYRWMVANAGRFGFVPYPFEPWHWEWTGEAP